MYSLFIGFSYFPIHQWFRFSAQIDIYIISIPIPLGTSYVSVRCRDYTYWRHSGYDLGLILQFRQNKTNEWETIVKSNRFGSFLTSNSTDIETNLLRNRMCDYHRFGCMIYANISIHLETCKDNLFPSFRCQLIDGPNTIDSSKEVQLEITGTWDKIEGKKLLHWSKMK